MYINRVFKQSPKSLGSWPEMERKKFSAYVDSQVYYQCNFYHHLKCQQLSNKGTLTSARRTLPLDVILSPGPQRQNNPFSYYENYPLMFPTNSFLHVLWSQDPNLDGLDSRRKQYGHNIHAMHFLFWARLYYWYHLHCGLMTPSAPQLLSLCSVWHRHALMCQSQNSRIPWKFRSASGELMKHLLDHELRTWVQSVDIHQLLGLLSWIFRSIRKVFVMFLYCLFVRRHLGLVSSLWNTTVFLLQ